MMEIALPRKLLRSTCSISVCAEHRVEQREQDEPGKEAADMRLPGDARAIGADRDRCDAEDQIDCEPHGEKGKHARIAERM